MTNRTAPLTLRSRQIHLDFHTSPFIPGVGADFDPEVFAQTMAEAHVNSVTIFAKCHHGMCYYPTKHGKVHPHLQRKDMLGETIEALHRRGIRAPIYTTVVWEENVADEHPEWRQMFADGRFAQLAASADMQTVQPGRWRFNNFADPDYQNYFEAHLAEILENYDVDGFFIDILFFYGGACFSEASRKKRAKLGLTRDDDRSNALFESAMQLEFSHRFTRFIHGRAPQVSIFYNSSNKAWVDHREGWAPRTRLQTHAEIESLPSGFWGYFHFPRLARQAMLWEDRPFLGMTGRFQKMWGDFGGLKPQAALEYECFRAQALGGGCSVGDQMYPGGTLDQGAYRMIGHVYRQVEAAEEFYSGTKPCPQGALLLAGNPGMDDGLSGQSEEGAVLMAEELHYDLAVVDDGQDFAPFAFLVLPDSTPVSSDLKEKLRRYHQAGGRLLVSHRAGCDSDGKWALDFLPVKIDGAEPLYPTYWRAKADFAPDYSDDCRVIYQQGLRVEAGPGTEVIVERILPYFKRSDLQFSSHFQTPPDLDAPPAAAVVAGERLVYFADPIFREYRQAGNVFIREIFGRALQHLGAEPLAGPGLDPHILVYPRRNDKDLHLTLLNYIPARKSLAIDVIERPLSFGGQSLKLGTQAGQLELWNGNALERAKDGSFPLPSDARGRLLLRAPGYFRD
jgi:hypothetical protein